MSDWLWQNQPQLRQAPLTCVYWLRINNSTFMLLAFESFLEHLKLGWSTCRYYHSSMTDAKRKRKAYHHNCIYGVRGLQVGGMGEWSVAETVTIWQLESQALVVAGRWRSQAAAIGDAHVRQKQSHRVQQSAALHQLPTEGQSRACSCQLHCVWPALLASHQPSCDFMASACMLMLFARTTLLLVICEVSSGNICCLPAMCAGDSPSCS